MPRKLVLVALLSLPTACNDAASDRVLSGDADEPETSAGEPEPCAAWCARADECWGTWDGCQTDCEYNLEFDLEPTCGEEITQVIQCAADLSCAELAPWQHWSNLVSAGRQDPQVPCHEVTAFLPDGCCV